MALPIPFEDREYLGRLCSRIVRDILVSSWRLRTLCRGTIPCFSHPFCDAFFYHTIHCNQREPRSTLIAEIPSHPHALVSHGGRFHTIRVVFVKHVYMPNVMETPRLPEKLGRLWTTRNEGSGKGKSRLGDSCLAFMDVETKLSLRNVSFTFHQ